MNCDVPQATTAHRWTDSVPTPEVRDRLEFPRMGWEFLDREWDLIAMKVVFLLLILLLVVITFKNP